MALKTIPELVRARLPYLTEAALETIVPDAVTEAAIELQTPLGKTDEETDAPEAWPGLQKLLLADYTAYNMLKVKALATVAGENGGAAGNRVLKRSKADVVEAEFESDTSGLSLRTGELLDQLKAAICNKAATLGVTLPLCDEGAECWVPPFIVV